MAIGKDWQAWHLDREAQSDDDVKTALLSMSFHTHVSGAATPPGYQLEVGVKAQGSS